MSRLGVYGFLVLIGGKSPAVSGSAAVLVQPLMGGKSLSCQLFGKTWRQLPVGDAFLLSPPPTVTDYPSGVLSSTTVV